MTTTANTPKSLADLLKLTAKYGKRALLVSAAEAAADRMPSGRVAIDISNVASLQEIIVEKNRVVVGAGVLLGRLVREAMGENGLIRQSASLIANPLVRNRVSLMNALSPESPYFDITTPLALLDSKIRLQSPNGKRTIPIMEFLETSAKGLKKGELPVAIEFAKLPSTDRVSFFRVARIGGKGSVSAAVRMKMVRGRCLDPEIFVSSLTLIPVRSKAAEQEIGGKVTSEGSIKRASKLAADEIGELAEKLNVYEHTLIEITVARTLRSIMDNSGI
jgi:carbon-monoxide dehydrogenase medium subunit